MRDEQHIARIPLKDLRSFKQMQLNLDELLGHLAAQTPDRNLDTVEAEVARRVAAMRRDRHLLAAILPVQVAALGLSLMMGIAVGGFLASSDPTRAWGPLFETVPPLAPSTLLEGR